MELSSRPNSQTSSKDTLTSKRHNRGSLILLMIYYGSIDKNIVIFTNILRKIKPLVYRINVKVYALCYVSVLYVDWTVAKEINK